MAKYRFDQIAINSTITTRMMPSTLHIVFSILTNFCQIYQKHGFGELFYPSNPCFI